MKSTLSGQRTWACPISIPSPPCQTQKYVVQLGEKYKWYVSRTSIEVQGRRGIWIWRECFSFQLSFPDSCSCSLGHLYFCNSYLLNSSFAQNSCVTNIYVYVCVDVDLDIGVCVCLHTMHIKNNDEDAFQCIHTLVTCAFILDFPLSLHL